MKITPKFKAITSKADPIQNLEGIIEKTGYDLNCMRIGIVQNFYPDDLTADILIVNKKELGLNQDGTPITRNFAPIRAKVVYCTPFATFPINQGDECLLLFSDREIESWFINGDINPIGYPRMHEFTDAVAIFGIRSLPKMIQILADCLNLFYAGSNIALSEDHINIYSQTVQASNFQAMNGASGNIIDSDGKTLAKVEYGIITEIY